MPHKIERIGPARRPVFTVFDGWTPADERALDRSRCDAIWLAGGRWPDLSFLAGRDRVKELRLQALRCTDARALARIPHLASLVVIGSEIRNLPGAGELPRLEAVDIEGWKRRDHTGILSQPRLQSIRLSIAREFDSFRLVDGAPRLERLVLEQCSLRSLAGIGALSRLRALEIAHPLRLRSLVGVGTAKALLVLLVWGHRRCTIDATALGAAEALRCISIDGMVEVAGDIRPLARLRALEIVCLGRHLSAADARILRGLPRLRHVHSADDESTLREMDLPVDPALPRDEYVDLFDYVLSPKRRPGGSRSMPSKRGSSRRSLRSNTTKRKRVP